MIAPETEAMFVARFLQREATSKRTIALNAQEKERGHDWVVPSEVVGCTEIIAVCRHIVGLEEALVDARQDLARRREVTKAHEQRTRKIVAAGSEALTRAEKAEAALAKALKVIEPFAKVYPKWIPNEAFHAASAFAAKHGWRDV